MDESVRLKRRSLINKWFYNQTYADSLHHPNVKQSKTSIKGNCKRSRVNTEETLGGEEPKHSKEFSRTIEMTCEAKLCFSQSVFNMNRTFPTTICTKVNVSHSIILRVISIATNVNRYSNGRRVKYGWSIRSLYVKVAGNNSHKKLNHIVIVGYHI